MAYINTTDVSNRYRRAAVDVAGKRMLISRIDGSEQAADLTVPPNCHGFGRIRHFRRNIHAGWPTDPLPIDPASKALGLSLDQEMLRAQVFQNAVCNWRCWYCFVPFNLLAGDLKRSEMLSADDLVDLYLAEADRPVVIDLSGGQPDLVPEWVPWMMNALQRRGLDQSTYLWSDDNLSTDYFWTKLSTADRQLVASYRNYGKVCCFKGYDADSFAFNTSASPELFDSQFEFFGRLLDFGIDLYAYVTLTGPACAGIREKVAKFVDRLQALHRLLPLRTVPLQVVEFGAMASRMRDRHQQAIRQQHIAISAWEDELYRRFSPGEVSTRIFDHTMR